MRKHSQMHKMALSSILSKATASHIFCQSRFRCRRVRFWGWQWDNQLETIWGSTFPRKEISFSWFEYVLCKIIPTEVYYILFIKRLIFLFSLFRFFILRIYSKLWSLCLESILKNILRSVRGEKNELEKNKEIFKRWIDRSSLSMFLLVTKGARKLFLF